LSSRTLHGFSSAVDVNKYEHVQYEQIRLRVQYVCEGWENISFLVDELDFFVQWITLLVESTSVG
jgi:hypothetical protein